MRRTTFILRVEAAAVCAIAVCAYAHTAVSWWIFALLFLVPDISMLGYVKGPRFGAFLYNLGHTYVVPVLLCAGVWFLGYDTLVAFGIVWIAHISFDRVLGFGLKQETGFKDTHLSA